MRSFHRLGVTGPTRALYDATLLGDTADWPHIHDEVTFLLAEHAGDSLEERRWLRYIYACALRRTGDNLTAIIERLNILLDEAHSLKQHTLTVAVTAELALAYDQADDDLRSMFLTINLRMAACDDDLCRHYLAAVEHLVPQLADASA